MSRASDPLVTAIVLIIGSVLLWPVMLDREIIDSWPTVSRPLPTRFSGELGRDLDGRPVSVSSWGDRLLLINVWATWCAPCRREISDLVRLQDEFKNDIQIVGVSIDTSVSAVRAFLSAVPVNYPIAVASPTSQAVPTTKTVPASYLLDSRRVVLWRHDGAVQYDVLKSIMATWAARGRAVGSRTIRER